MHKEKPKVVLIMQHPDFFQYLSSKMAENLVSYLEFIFLFVQKPHANCVQIFQLLLIYIANSGLKSVITILFSQRNFVFENSDSISFIFFIGLRKEQSIGKAIVQLLNVFGLERL